MRFHRLHPRERALAHRAMIEARQGGFHPSQVSKLGAWLRLASSTAVSGEWETVEDVIGGTDATQTDADRKPAVSADSNGLPTATFDGSDMWRFPLAANTYNTSKLGVSWWVKGATLGTSQYYWSIFNNDSSGRSVVVRQFNGAIIVDIYIGSNLDGRSYATATSLLSDSAFRYPRVQLDMTKTDECDTTGSNADAKVRVFVGETARSLTPSSIGSGGTLSSLRSVTGAWILGALNDSDTPSSPSLNGTIWGPNSYIWLDTPTAQEAANVMAFETPT